MDRDGGTPLRGQQASEKELIAVLDLDIQGATKEQGSALTDKLREELLKTGRFTLVDRSQLNAVLDEQALQATGCTSQECAVQVGRVLGIRKIVTGKLTKVGENLWQVSTLMLDVETAETLRAESVLHEGSFVGLLTGGGAELAAKLSGTAAPPPAAAAPRLAQKTGQVFIASDPTGADIVLDGRPTGQKTDALLENVPEGEHTVVLQKGNLMATSKTSVRANEIVGLELKLTLASAVVTVTSRPFNARIRLDGVDKGQTLARLETTVGKHEIEISLEGYLAVTRQIDVVLGGENRVHADLVQGGTLRLTALSSEHVITIDQVPRKPELPRGTLLLAPGAHQVGMNREGFLSRAANVEIQAGKETELNVGLVPLQGTLTIITTPADADVEFSGGKYVPTRDIKRAPLTGLLVPVGEYKLTARSPGYWPVTQGVSVAGDQETQVQLSLQKAANLRVKTEPANAEVRLDGEVIGRAEIDVAPGRHRIQVSEQSGDYATGERAIELKPGETREETIRLERSPAFLARESYESSHAWWTAGRGLTVFLTLLAGGAAAYETYMVSQSNAKQKELREKAEAAITQAEFDDYYQQIVAERKLGEKHADQAETYSTAFAALFVLYVSLGFMEPEPPAVTFLVLPPAPEETSIRVAVAYRW